MNRKASPCEHPSSRLFCNDFPPRWHAILITLVSLFCYLNSLGCGFAFDDMSAIRDNRDLRPQTPLSQLFVNDFWGQDILKEQSHKSYRPLCVLTFRLNYLIHEIDPMGYHVVNVVLHAIVCLIYHRLCNIFMPHSASLVASLIFAVHPIHTEAVSGVVGRAETLSSVFFLLAFMSFIKATKHRTTTEWLRLLSCIVLIIMAMLSKEQGITVVAVCVLHEVFINQNIKFASLLLLMQNLMTLKVPIPSWMKESCKRLIVLSVSCWLMIMVRLHIMGSQLPVFTKFDNPAAVADSPARELTYNFLFPMNIWLLLFPSDLCCDWTMGTIPLLQSFTDTRNFATIIFYLAFAILIWHSQRKADQMTHQVIVISLSLMVFPFLPASNLFFPVGFVIAERVLYMPSMGLCMLVGYGWYLIHDKLISHENACLKSLSGTQNKSCDLKLNISKKFLIGALITSLVFYAMKTILRNYDWESEHTIFMAGLKVNNRNAKLYNNVGHALESQAKYHEALEYFLKAVDVQPDDLGAHMNVGRTYNNLEKFDLAEEAFLRAKALLPQPRPGESYQARVAPSHLNLFLNLANLIARNKSRLEEADRLYRQVINMRSDYTQAYINRGDVLIKLNRTRDAQEVYEQALQIDSSNPDIYYNLGVVFLKQTKAAQALIYFDKALELEPNHEQALMNSAMLMQEMRNPNLRPLAQKRLLSLVESGRSNERVCFSLGMLGIDAEDYEEAEKWFRAAIEIKQDFRSATFNLALLLSDSNRQLEAVPILKQLLLYHSNHIKGLVLLRDIYINHVKDLDAAEECYKRIIKLDPSYV